MRFVCDITHNGNTVARMSCDERPGEDAETTADRAKASLLRDAYRHGREVHPAIETIAEEYHRHVSSKLETRSGGRLSVICDDDGEILAKMPGGVVVSIGINKRQSEWSSQIQAMSDAEIAERDAFVDRILSRP